MDRTSIIVLVVISLTLFLLVAWVVVSVFVKDTDGGDAVEDGAEMDDGGLPPERWLDDDDEDEHGPV